METKKNFKMVEAVLKKRSERGPHRVLRAYCIFHFKPLGTRRNVLYSQSSVLINSISRSKANRKPQKISVTYDRLFRNFDQKSALVPRVASRFKRRRGKLALYNDFPRHLALQYQCPSVI